MLEILAKRAADEIPNDADVEPTYKFDPTIILVIMEILRVLIPIIQERCQASARGVKEMAAGCCEPTSLVDWLRWRVVVNAVRDQVPRQARKMIGWYVIERSICRMAAACDEVEIEMAIDEVA